MTAIISAVGKQVPDAGPAFADRIENGLSAGAVGDVGRRQVDQQQATAGIDGDMALATDDLLGPVEAAGATGRRGLDRLTVDDAGAGLRPARSRSIISATSWIVWNSNRRTNRRNHQ